ncbi:MAG: hypothetical protein IKE29_20595 [Paenibacillus sp.]|uniref:hypothetical protein n=1 Tax=Paenibacillus sp. TaxID=58172 RepID=UPI0025CC6AA3|nr:hypothetical protein [Paenibacillus sp.]MBR2566993.1 hypothetical protein [Paenibacillus sp.]
MNTYTAFLVLITRDGYEPRLGAVPKHEYSITSPPPCLMEKKTPALVPDRTHRRNYIRKSRSSKISEERLCAIAIAERSHCRASAHFMQELWLKTKPQLMPEPQNPAGGSDH